MQNPFPEVTSEGQHQVTSVCPPLFYMQEVAEFIFETDEEF